VPFSAHRERELIFIPLRNQLFKLRGRSMCV
jgi:hypothetical protein